MEKIEIFEALKICPQGNFNKEVIWDSKKPIFDLYFRDNIMKSKYRYALVQIQENLSFEKSLRVLSTT